MNITPKLGKRLGRIKDADDKRDFSISAPCLRGRAALSEDRPIQAPLPSSVDVFHGLSLPVYDQGNLGCHDDETEVLTSDGWKTWEEYDGRFSLATLSPLTHKMEFQRPLAIHRYEYAGPLCYGHHKSLDYAVTPNHRMLVRKWNQRAKTLDDSYRFIEAERLGWYSGLCAAPSGLEGVGIGTVQIGPRVYSGDDFICLLALILSDGWVGGTESNWNTLSFCCFRGDRQPFVREFAERMKFSEIPSRPGVWKWTDPEMAQWIRCNCYTSRSEFRVYTKKVPQAIKRTSQVQIELFLRFFGDQHIGKNRQFYTSSTQLADDLQELLLRVGKRSGIYEDIPQDVTMKDGRTIEASNCQTGYVVTEWNTDQLSIDRKEHCGQEFYRGNVFCASVPNSTLITRRNRQILVSGNSCTANAGVLYRRFLAQKFRKYSAPDQDLSRLFLYFQEREREGTVNEDAGAQIRDTFKSLAQVGVCPEKDDPYDPTKFNDCDNDTQACMAAASAYKIGAYHRISDVDTARSVLASGYAIELGFAVYESFESIGADGIMPMPKVPGEQQLGGHAVVIRGYDDTGSRFRIQNSWGPNWGDHGCFWMPYEFLEDSKLSDPDMWMGHLGTPWK